MKLLWLLLFIITNASAADLIFCEGAYALCAASGATPTGNAMSIGGRKFLEGMAVCPVIIGVSIGNGALMKSGCKAPEGKVWSLFGAVTSLPQAPSWAVAPLVSRTFTLTKDDQMSNMWSMPCTLQLKPVNGVTLANCYGPLNESPFDNGHIKPGSKIVTDAPVGVQYPVGGNIK